MRRTFVSAPVVADGRMLTLDAIGGVLAFDADDGRFLWRTEVINPIAPRGQPFLLQGVGAPAPVSADGQVFAVDVTGRVYAFDAETGASLWDQALNDPSRVLAPAPHATIRCSSQRTPARSTRSIAERPSRVAGRCRGGPSSGACRMRATCSSG